MAGKRIVFDLPALGFVRLAFWIFGNGGNRDVEVRQFAQERVEALRLGCPIDLWAQPHQKTGQIVQIGGVAAKEKGEDSLRARQGIS